VPTVSQTTTPEDFNERLKLALRFKGMSPEQLSIRLGRAVTARTIWRWLAGTSEPSISALKLLAPTLGVTADWLLALDAPAPVAHATAA
jgi:transcriptional regulator with XRE-family HTH domain